MLLSQMKKQALISVFDKTGVAEFAAGLGDLGYTILSTGGTSSALAAANVHVTEVSDITGFPECLDGRVKTLHPAVHAGILAMRENDGHMKRIQELGINPIDIVAINLYPFKQTIMRPGATLEDAIENIDIGGPTALRAAAKNWRDVTVICDPADYAPVLAELRENGATSRETRFRLAGKVFAATAAYDALISRYLLDRRYESVLSQDTLTLTFEKQQELRYGENPHQPAAFFKETGASYGNTLADATQLWGKELSYNNINDANGALDVLKEFAETTPCAVGVKHANPCGVGTGGTISEAWERAYSADPVSIFGGVVALNRECDKATAESLVRIFLEIVIAPSFSQEALCILKTKKKLRVLALPLCAKPNSEGMLELKKVAGGLLAQALDTALAPDDIKVVTKRHPNRKEMDDLLFAWRVVKHTKSNGIALAKDCATVGIGPGQTNRITALELAIKYAGDRAAGSVMASDAFFPFDDCVKAAAAAGITAIIQPGGSIKDEDSIKAADEAGISMVFTGMRHFKH